MTRRTELVAGMLSLLAVGSCFDPDLEGTPCGNNGSCPPGLVCDLPTAVCVEATDCDQPPCQPPAEPVDRVVATIRNEVDLLFVIDNSGSMLEEQASLAAQFSQMLDVFATGGALPSLHVGVISTDMGIGPNFVTNCDGSGDDGQLQFMPLSMCTEGPSDPYIRDVINPDGSRSTNYDSTLSAAFACIAQLGIEGCGFERPLDSIVRAVDGTVDVNQGFIREDALLGIFIITDEDDCSVSDTRLFNTSQTAIDSELGPASSYRCFEFGVSCSDGTPPREAGLRTGCEPKRDSPFMPHVDVYVDRIAEAKKHGKRDIVVGAAIGDLEPIDVAIETIGGFLEVVLQPSCATAAGAAAPAVRLAYFVEQFAHGRRDSICQSDFSDLLSGFAADISRTLHNPCLTDKLYDTDLTRPGIQPSCSATQEQDGADVPLPECSHPDSPASSDELPCFLVREDPTCTGPQGLSFEVVRIESSFDEAATASCLVEP